MKNNKSAITKTISILFLCLILSSCESEFEDTSKKEVVFYLNGEVLQGQVGSLVTDENNPSNKYSRIDSVLVYGIGVDFFLPDSLKDTDLKVIISGKIRESESINSSIAVSLHGNADSIYYWGELYSGQHIKQLNSWTPFKDSLIIEQKVNNQRSKNLQIFSRKFAGKGFFDVDDLTVRITRE